MRTGAQRLRPVVRTSVTTALGFMPMVIGVNLNLFTREIVYGAPSTQWWTELSSAIAGGLVGPDQIEYFLGVTIDLINVIAKPIIGRTGIQTVAGLC